MTDPIFAAHQRGVYRLTGNAPALRGNVADAEPNPALSAFVWSTTVQRQGVMERELACQKRHWLDV
ncbi:MAG: hypothetical protein ACI9W2_005164 [Gammaproteobacteria bacterium]|jgi:hypothetical protein